MERRSRTTFSTPFWFSLLLAASATAKPILSGADLVNLVDSTLKGVSSNVKDLFLFGSSPSVTSSCKVYPGDANWPSNEAWEKLDELTDNRLLTRPEPQASVCYNGPLYDAEKCAEITAVWSRSYSHFIDPIEMMSPVAQGMTCLPP